MILAQADLEDQIDSWVRDRLRPGWQDLGDGRRGSTVERLERRPGGSGPSVPSRTSLEASGSVRSPGVLAPTANALAAGMDDGSVAFGWTSRRSGKET